MISIVGAGVTGLVAAAYLKKAGKKVQLFDSRGQAGGNIRSLQKKEYLLELGPNSLVLNDELYAFLEEWDLASEILYANPKAKFRFILKNGKYRKLPSGPISLIGSRTFSFSAKRALLRERKLSPQFRPGDSIDAFFRKRLNDEWTDYVVHPFISGVFAGDPRQLLLEKAFPRILQLEQEHGSLLKGMMANRKKQVHRGTISFPRGIQQMTDKLAAYLNKDLHLEHSLLAVRESGIGKLTLQFKQKELETETLLLCLPAYQSARLLKDLAPGLSQALEAIVYPPVAMVFSAYPKKSVKHKLNGFGALHNNIEEVFGLGSIMNSSVFPGRCPEDEVLLTTFVGGDLYPHRARLEDQPILDKVDAELKRFLNIKGEPTMQHIQRWPRAIPQYKSSVLASHEQSASLEGKGIFLGGNWIGGISVPDSIKAGRRLATRLLGEEENEGR